MKFLSEVRTPGNHGSLKKQIFMTIGILLLGLCLGTFSKFLDYRQAELPQFFMFIDSALDFHNFLGTFAPWVVIAVFISIKSSSAIRAGINVFLFFAGMVTSYYLYSNYVAGFFPKSYAMIWVGFTLISPILAFFCWYAKGDGWFAILISAGILGFMINSTLSYGMWYINIRSFLHLMMLFLGIIILHKPIKETAYIIALAIPITVLLDILIPFHY